MNLSEESKREVKELISKELEGLFNVPANHKRLTKAVAESKIQFKTKYGREPTKEESSILFKTCVGEILHEYFNEAKLAREHPLS